MTILYNYCKTDYIIDSIRLHNSTIPIKLEHLSNRVLAVASDSIYVAISMSLKDARSILSENLPTLYRLRRNRFHERMNGAITHNFR